MYTKVGDLRKAERSNKREFPDLLTVLQIVMCLPAVVLNTLFMIAVMMGSSTEGTGKVVQGFSIVLLAGIFYILVQIYRKLDKYGSN